MMNINDPGQPQAEIQVFLQYWLETRGIQYLASYKSLEEALSHWHHGRLHTKEPKKFSSVLALDPMGRWCELEEVTLEETKRIQEDREADSDEEFRYTHDEGTLDNVFDR